MQLLRSVIGLATGYLIGSNYDDPFPPPSTDNRPAVAALGSASSAGVVTNETLGDRSYLLFVPASYSPGTPAPVILSFHGGDRTADEQLALDLLTDPFFNTEYIVVYPYGVDVRSCIHPP